MISASEINSTPATKLNQQQTAVRLTCEVVLVLILALTLINLSSNIFSGRGDWLIVPVIFVALALVPTRLRKVKLTETGLNFKHLKSALLLPLVVSLIIFPVTVVGLLILRHFNLAAPLIPQVPSELWLSWIFYQVMYIAVAEEIFFRGYCQSTIYQILVSLNFKNPPRQAYLPIIFSAGIFALAHVALANNLLAIVTFFPGIILGWLFLRTKSVIAPIIFHALANIFYAGVTHWLV